MVSQHTPSHWEGASVIINKMRLCVVLFAIVALTGLVLLPLGTALGQEVNPESL